jgi:ATP/ADP translocase
MAKLEKALVSIVAVLSAAVMIIFFSLLFVVKIIMSGMAWMFYFPSFLLKSVADFISKVPTRLTKYLILRGKK